MLQIGENGIDDKATLSWPNMTLINNGRGLKGNTFLDVTF